METIYRYGKVEETFVYPTHGDTIQDTNRYFSE